MDFLLKTFCSCTKDSYFIVPHEKLRFLSLKFTLKLKPYRDCKMGSCTYSQTLVGDPGWNFSHWRSHPWLLPPALPFPVACFHVPNMPCNPVEYYVLALWKLRPWCQLAYPGQCQAPPFNGLGYLAQHPVRCPVGGGGRQLACSG